jgi:hypothetical protein
VNLGHGHERWARAGRVLCIRPDALGDAPTHLAASVGTRGRRVPRAGIAPEDVATAVRDMTGEARAMPQATAHAIHG